MPPPRPPRPQLRPRRYRHRLRQLSRVQCVGTKDPRVDAYIAESADFARPILRQVRKIVHATCPNVEETLKWGAPFFVDGGIVAGMASFKQHCGIVFWHYEPGSWAAKNDQGRGEVGKLKSL